MMYVKQSRHVCEDSRGACMRARAGVGLLRIDTRGVDFLQILKYTARKFVETFIARVVSI